ncbi:MAG: GNAT family N-acetyltransferase [Cyclobacteriaceae bacterium]
MVEIVSFQPMYATAFRNLNYAWIKQLFEVEESDKKILGDPQGAIIDKGGEVLIALLNGEPVGTCALVKKDQKTYELAKMAVSEDARGNQIGWKLGNAIVEKARELDAERLILETNSSLKPAIGLYRKLGFKEAHHTDSDYQRCNIQMELKF